MATYKTARLQQCRATSITHIKRRQAIKASSNITTFAIAALATAFTTTPTKASNNTQESVWIEVSKDGIRSRLKDPGSAQFRNVFFSRADGTPVVCGEVNSKNSFGAYGGYQRFVASGEDLAFLEREVSGFSAVWQQLCGH